MKWFVRMAWGLCAILCHADTAYVDFENGLIHPSELGGMLCERVEKYENTEMGYSVFYRKGEAFEAEVSVFNLGRDTIESGHLADGVQVMHQSVSQRLERHEEKGLLQKVKKRGETVTPPKGPIRFSNKVYQLYEPRAAEAKTNNVPRILSVYVTGARNNLVKVEFRFDVAGNKDARGMSERMLKQLIGILETEPNDEQLILAACAALVYDPAGSGGRAAAQRVVEKTQTMGDLEIYDAFFVWPQDYSKPENADLLTAAYFAGMLKVVIPQKLEHGGDQEAFVAMLKAYAAMRARDDIKPIPKLDEWVGAADKAALYKKLLVEFSYVHP
jgi:hypothetical protein